MSDLTKTYLDRISGNLSGDPLIETSSGTSGQSLSNINLGGAGGKTGSGSNSPLVFIFDGGGSAITSGAEAWLSVPYFGVLTSWRILADPSGSITIDIWKDTYTNWPPTDLDSITNNNEPEVVTATKAEREITGGLSGGVTTSTEGNTEWSSLVFDEGDIFMAHVDSVTDIERAWLMLEVE